jgi:MOSC domain-containing protein YiiM
VKSPENKHLLRGLAHRGGLRARILSGGTITVGDTIELTSVISTRRGSTRKAPGAANTQR